MTWNLHGNLGSGYTPPLSPNIGGDVAPPSSQLSPFGYEATEWGQASVINRFQYADPIGIFETSFGAHSVFQTQQVISVSISGDLGSAVVFNYSSYAFPEGVHSLVFGSHSVLNTSVQIYPSGWDSLVIGPAESPHWISYYLSAMSPSGIGSLEFGAHLVADAIRFLRPSSISGVVGSPQVTNYTRTLEAIGFRTDVVGAHEVGTTQTVSPFGFESLRFGTTLATDDRQFVSVGGIAGQFGLGLVRRLKEFLHPDAATQGTQFGPVDVFNRNQRVTTRWPEEHVAGPVSAPLVELKDRQVFPFGFDALRFSPLGLSTRLGPPPIEAGLGNTTAFGFALVAPRVRSVSAIGRSMDAYGFAIASNAAENFTPIPFDAARYGQPSVLNLWQFFRGFGAGSQLGMGTAFVAPRVRTLIATGTFTFEAGRDHYVGHDPQEAAPASITGRFGLAFVQNRPKRFITVRTDQPGTVEIPVIFNRNRVVRPMSFQTDTYGAPDIQNYRRFLRPLGFEALVPGQHQIGDRVKTARPPSITGTGGFHRVRLIPEPPQPQDVYPFWNGGTEFGDVSVSGNSVFPEGIGSLQFGQTTVVHYGIFPEGWHSLEMVSTRPDVISYKLVLLGPTDEYPLLEEFGIRPPDWGLPEAPRISPYTVWAPTGAPPQARENHPPGLEEPIGIRRGGDIVTGGLVEEPWVSHYVRYLNPDPVIGAFGNATIARDDPIIIYPSGFRGRWGFPFLLGGDLDVRPIGAESLEFGLGVVSAPNVGPRTALPSGITGAFGQAWISRNPEEVYPQGYEPLQMGGGLGGSGGLWVSNEYPPFPVPGFDATEWGMAWVSTNPQAVHPFGWDSFISEPEEIALRMRVRSRAFALTLGSNTQQFGVALVEYGLRTIQAFSLFRRDVPAPRVAFGSGPSGVDSLEFANPVVDQVEHGIIKAKGWLNEAFGKPVINASISASGIFGSFGAAGVYHRITPVSIAGVFGDALVTGDAGHVCGMLPRGMRPVWTDDEEFGVAEVEHG